MNEKKAAQKMSLMMGGAMSLTLSLVGLLNSGSFTLSGYMISVAVSFCISLVLGKIIPVRRLSLSALKKLNLSPASLKGRLVDALVSDLSYTPIMTFIMVFIAYKQAVSQGARIPFVPMLMRSELISMIAAFIMIFFISPVLMKIAFRDSGKSE